MDREALIHLLAEFFLDEFKNDSIGVADWLAQGGHNVDDIVPEVREILGDPRTPEYGVAG